MHVEESGVGSRPRVLVLWVAPEGRWHGVARQLVSEAGRHCGATASDLAWAGPVTGNGCLLARSMAPNGM